MHNKIKHKTRSAAKKLPPLHFGNKSLKLKYKCMQTLALDTEVDIPFVFIGRQFCFCRKT